MCGIIGYCSKNSKASSVIFEDLKRMEYRGYDSSGIAMISAGKLIIRKGIGKLDEVNERYKLDKIPGHVGIGHTRWATHGGVTQPNSHPHADCTGQIAVIHNGIIDNYQELRKDLIKRSQPVSRSPGHLFRAAFRHLRRPGGAPDQDTNRLGPRPRLAG